jgi:FAD/FMN-containing dehydrogenase
MIAVIKSTLDVQKSIQWARSRSIQIVVQSSGHDFQGRSTADGAFGVFGYSYVLHHSQISVQFVLRKEKVAI